VRIGSLEVRIVSPVAAKAPPTRQFVTAPTPARPAPPVSTLSRGFRSFGLVQG
jgi:hypothetical protein